MEGKKGKPVKNKNSEFHLLKACSIFESTGKLLDFPQRSHNVQIALSAQALLAGWFGQSGQIAQPSLR